MQKKAHLFWFIFWLFSLFINACNTQPATPVPTPTPIAAKPADQPELAPLPQGFPQIAVHRDPATWQREAVTELEHFDFNSYKTVMGLFQLDYRSSDLSQFDLKGANKDLLYTTFDSKTMWPAPEKMPKEYDWQQILENNKNPGPGLRQLHQLGITGRGIGIAIIAQPLLVDHVEIADHIQFYEEAPDVQGNWAESYRFGPGYGQALVSLIAGKTTGIAPQADIYYYAVSQCETADQKNNNWACLVPAIQRIIAVNEQLPAERKIHFLFIPFDLRLGTPGYQDAMAAVKEAEAAGINIVAQFSPFKYIGAGRVPTDDPDRFESYGPSMYLTEKYFESASGILHSQAYVPMDSHTLASPTGPQDYAFYRQGGSDWACAYLAGVYALALQVQPDLTEKAFWEMAVKTGASTRIKHGSKLYSFGPIINPAALITELQSQ